MLRTTDGRKNYSSYLDRAIRKHGEQLNLGYIPSKFLPYFNTGQRIKVRMYGELVTGTVGVTTGHQPVLLLIRRSDSLGSSDILRHDTEIVAVQYGARYVPVENLPMNPNSVTGTG